MSSQPLPSRSIPHQWYYIKEGLLNETEEGPFDENQLVQLVKGGKLKLKSKLRSPTRTKNQLIYAESVPKLANLINQVKLDAEAKKQAESEQRKAEKKAIADQKAAEKHQLELQRQHAMHQQQLAQQQAHLEMQKSHAFAQQQMAIQYAGQPQLYVVNQGNGTSNALAAVVNLFIPPWGQLVQGRIAAFFIWYAIFIGTAITCFVLSFVVIGFILAIIAAPILYIWCIIDAATYKG